MIFWGPRWPSWFKLLDKKPDLEMTLNSAVMFLTYQNILKNLGDSVEKG
jgi:hypothetical protein